MGVITIDKSQAIQHFWSSFDIPAYDENTVPDDAQMPYITYNVVTNAVDSVTLLTASVWYRSSSWVDISKKVDEIAAKLASTGYYSAPLDDGVVWMVQGSPFAQRMSDPEDDMIRRYYLNVTAEFLTAT